MATVVARFAEFERERASERRLEALEALRAQGRWPSGRPPYGWKPEKRDDGYYLVPDEGATADVLRSMVADVIGGKSYGKVVRGLQEAATPTQNGKPWVPEMVRYVLHADSTS